MSLQGLRSPLGVKSVGFVDRVSWTDGTGTFDEVE